MSEGDRNRSLSETSDTEYDPQFSPIITLPEVTVPTNEEDEEVLLKLRAKLYRFDKSSDGAEWKERGTGELKMLKHKENKTVRIVMRRDKTLKVCANHFVTPIMQLKPKAGLDKAFVYTVPADFSDEQIKSECLAIKFATVDFANQFKNTFLDAQKYVGKECKLYNGEAELEDSDSDVDDDEEEDDEDKENKEADVVVEQKKNNAGEELSERLKDLDVSAKSNGNQ